MQKLFDVLNELHFSQTEIEKSLPLLEKFTNEIRLFNSAYNLTNTSEPDEIAVQHIGDSLAGLKTIKTLIQKIKNRQATKNVTIKIGDIGSGAGFPGIPLAIFLPDENFTLIERMDKRCAFLENATAILGLKNVEIIKSEVEKVEKSSFDITTFRAFRPLEKKMAKTLLSITKSGGFIVAYKAKFFTIREEMQKISDIIKSYEIVPLSPPFMNDKERNLVVVEVK